MFIMVLLAFFKVLYYNDDHSPDDEDVEQKLWHYCR